MTNLILCCVTLVCVPDDGPLRVETCSNIRSDIYIRTHTHIYMCVYMYVRVYITPIYIVYIYKESEREREE